MRDPDIRALTRRWRAAVVVAAWATLSLSATEALAQDAAAPEWGILSRGEIRNRLDDDPSAAASVVFDRGIITVGPGFKFTFERHQRIQIFGPAGYQFANIEIRHHPSEKIEKLEAHTLTPDGRRVDLKREQVYETKTNDLVKRVFAFPEVSPGCVVEYRYKLASNNFYYLRPWAFQREIPTEYSELSVRLPEGFEYEAVLNNADLVSGPDTSYFSSLNHKMTQIRQFTWRSRHLAPLIGEPLVSSILDHRVQLDFQIVRYRDDTKVFEFVDSWPDLAKQVRHVYRPLLRTDDQWPRWQSEGKDERILARRVHAFVRDSVAHVGETQAVAGSGLRSARDVYAQRRGTGLEKNLLLIALFRHHGLDAYPVLISRRDHLRFDRRDHRLDQFNYALVMLELGKERIFCDANSPGAWLGYLPAIDQVDAGILIGYPNEREIVIDIPAPPVESSLKGLARMQLNADGSATGTLVAELAGEAAYDLIRALADHDPAGYIQRTWFPKAVPSGIRVTRTGEEWEPITFTADIDLPEAADADDGRLFLRPSIMRRLESNPLMTSTRRYPISFETPWTEECRIVWTPPSGFKINELPAPREMTGDGYEFRSSVVMDGESIVATRLWRMSKRDFPVNRFEDLRELFSSVQLSQRGLLVLYSGK